jgi:hypothetical protein
MSAQGLLPQKRSGAFKRFDDTNRANDYGIHLRAQRDTARRRQLSNAIQDSRSYAGKSGREGRTIAPDLDQATVDAVVGRMQSLEGPHSVSRIRAVPSHDAEPASSWPVLAGAASWLILPSSPSPEGCPRVDKQTGDTGDLARSRTVEWEAPPPEEGWISVAPGTSIANAVRPMTDRVLQVPKRKSSMGRF